MTDTNPYANAARTHKAALLAVTLIACGVTAEQAETMDENAWRNAADAAGVSIMGRPSGPVARIVGDLLRKHDRIKALALVATS